MRTANIEHSVLPQARKASFVLHAFVKKTSRTPRADILLARKRLKEMNNDD